MVRPDQGSLLACKLAEVSLTAAAHERYLARAGTPQSPAELLRHTLIGLDRDETILHGFAALGLPVTRGHFALRTAGTVANGQLEAGCAGIGYVSRTALRHWPGVVPVLPALPIAPLPCWLAVHREIHGNRLVRRVFDFLAQAVPAELAAAP
jgi:DNA-binding transcriptional LysR family regulator